MEKYFRAVQATDGNTAHAHSMLYNQSYRHTLRICNFYCTNAPRCYVIRTLPVWLCFYGIKKCLPDSQGKKGVTSVTIILEAKYGGRCYVHKTVKIRNNRRRVQHEELCNFKCPRRILPRCLNPERWAVWHVGVN